MDVQTGGKKTDYENETSSMKASEEQVQETSLKSLLERDSSFDAFDEFRILIHFKNSFEDKNASEVKGQTNLDC